LDLMGEAQLQCEPARHFFSDLTSSALRCRVLYQMFATLTV
jgi:hypothetical protein